MTKREFKKLHGFYPHEEACTCRRRRADHTVWNTDPTFTCIAFFGTNLKWTRK